MSTEAKQIMQKLNEIQSDIDFLKKHMVDFDAVLSADDLESIEEAEKELAEGKTKRL